jgi:hypothetical protein
MLLLLLDASSDHSSPFSSISYLLALEGDRSPDEMASRLKQLATNNTLTRVAAGPSDLAFNGETGKTQEKC